MWKPPFPFRNSKEKGACKLCFLFHTFFQFVSLRIGECWVQWLEAGVPKMVRTKSFWKMGEERISAQQDFCLDIRN